MQNRIIPNFTRALMFILIAATIFSADDICANANSNIGDGKYILLSNEVTVSMSFKGGYSNYDFNHCVIVVERGVDKYELHTLLDPSGDVPTDVNRVKEKCRWDGKYLLIGVDGGGGNAWRCRVKYVFTIRNNRLNCLGEALQKEIIDGKEFFTDAYDYFEANSLTSHGGAPGITIVKYDDGKELIVDLENTWKYNQDSYSTKESIITKARNSLSSRHINGNNAATMDDIIGALFFNGLLSKYCNKSEEYSKALNASEYLLDESMLLELKEYLDSVDPGELPREWKETYMLNS